jgi:hypothetical protein
MSTLKCLLLTAASCAMVSWSMTGCAATPTAYNPDGLGSAQFARVAEICQTVMGLSPSEGLSGGNWRHNDRLDYWTNHYRGCIVSLSDSLQRVSDVQVAQQADADCRAKGFKSDSPDLALCVLRSVNSHPDPATTQASSAAALPISETVTPAGSFFYASPHETVRREQVACAALGLEPAHGAFESCVKGLSDTLDAIDNPIN